MDSYYVMHYTISSLYTVKKLYLSIQGTVFHFTRISLCTISLEKQKSCKVRLRATCNIKIYSIFKYLYTLLVCVWYVNIKLKFFILINSLQRKKGLKRVNSNLNSQICKLILKFLIVNILIFGKCFIFSQTLRKTNWNLI